MTMLNHCILGVGLHNITGQQLPIRILSHLGDCIDYKAVCQSETAEAEIARQLYQEGSSPGLRPISEDDVVLTHFWADNFDKKLKSDKGNDMINSIHLVKFQEKAVGSVSQSRQDCFRTITHSSTDLQRRMKRFALTKIKNQKNLQVVITMF